MTEAGGGDRPTREEAEALHARVLAAVAGRERDPWTLGAALAEMLLTGGHTLLGYAAFEQYLEGPLGLHRATGYRFVRLHAIYGQVAAALPDPDLHRLDILHHLFRPGDPPERVIALVRQAATWPMDRLRLVAGREARRREETPAAQYRLPERLPD